MTLIAALVFPDQMLMASESKVTMKGFKGETPKLHTISGLSFMCAGAGEKEVIDHFGRWANDYDWLK